MSKRTVAVGGAPADALPARRTSRARSATRACTASRPSSARTRSRSTRGHGVSSRNGSDDAELRERAAVVARVRRRRHDVEPVEREHAGDLAEDAGPVVGHDGEQLAAGRRSAVPGSDEQRAVLGVRELGDLDLARGRRRPCTCVTRSTSSATSCAFAGPHAAGPGRERVGFGQRGEQLQRLDRRDLLGDALRSSPGSSRSRRIATSDSSRWLRDQLGEHVDVGVGKPEPRRRAAARARRRPRCGRRRSPLPRSCSSAPMTSRSGRSTRSAQRRRVRDGLEQVPVDGEAVVRVALRTRAHRLPLGQDRASRCRGGRAPRSPGSRAAPASSSPTSSSRASGGHGSGSAGARSARRSSESRSITVSCSRGQPRRAQREQRVVGRIGVGVEVHLAVAQDRRPAPSVAIALADAARAGRATTTGPAATRRRSSTRSRAPADAIVGHERVAVGDAERVGDRVLLLQREHVARAAGAAVQLDARVEQRRRTRSRGSASSCSSRIAARGLRPVQRMHVAQSAASFLEIGLEHERDFAGLRVARVDAARELFEPALRPLLPLRSRRGRRDPS